ncbi:MAG: biopolymer transporter ExbD [Prevotella sp.]|jgi:biopolymer transport protein ExbD|nr:biopolymer transporter ExbD [Prevotella sp.]MCI1282046.1 biopolymer transporter ExbD [Prevotella sp.]
MSMFRRREHQVPGLNTASLPDLIFSVLFFFMIVTHMRKVTLRVKFQVPQGTELTRLTKKTDVSYIYIGHLLGQKSGTMIQMNDKLVTAAEVEDYLSADRNRMDPDDVDKMTVSLMADKGTRMGVVNDVKQSLRRAKVLKINYSASEIKK